MLQQAIKSEQQNASDEVMEEHTQAVSQRPAVTISGPVKSGRSHANAIMSPFNPAGFSMIKSPEEIARAGQNTLDALKKSAAALADGVGEISQHIAATTHQSVEAHLATGKKALDIKTPNDWLEFQSKWVGDLVNTTVAQMAHFSKLSTKIVDQTCEPLKKHFGTEFGKTDGHTDG